MKKNKISKFIFFIVSLTLISSCSITQFPEFRKNADEQVVYKRIQELRENERTFLASEYAIEFGKRFPNSPKREELDLFVADEKFANKEWEVAKSSYENFIVTHPNSLSVPKAKAQIVKSDHEQFRFHKHLDLNYYVGPQINSIGGLNKAVEAYHSMAQLSLTYFFHPNHGVFISSQNHYFKADSSEISEANSRKDKSVNILLRSIGYSHRWKLAQKFNTVYSIGAGSERIRFTDDKDPQSVTTLGFQQSLTLDYCAFAKKNELCWNGFFPSVGIFHIYSPNRGLGRNNLDGHLFGAGVGFRM